MTLTVQKAIDHIRHEIGAAPSSEINETEAVSQTYQVLCSMHRWRFLSRGSVALAMGKGESSLRLPVDVYRPLSIEGDGSIVRHMQLVDLNQVHEARRWSATPNTGSHWAAVHHRVPTPRNVLLYSEQFDQSAWAEVAGSTISVTPNVATSPIDGTASVVDRILDTSSGAIGTLEQVVPVHLTPTGDYFAEAIMRPVDSSGVLASNPPKTFLSLETPSPSDSGLQSLLEINWGAEPWRDPPTVFILDPSTDDVPTANTGLALPGTPEAVGEGFWKFQIRGYAHNLAENYGRINFRIAPAAAVFGSADGATSGVPFNVGVEVVRAQLCQGRLNVPYELVTSAVTIPTVPRPFLEVHPAAAEDQDQPFTLFYDRGPVTFELVTEEIPIPFYCEVLFLELLRALVSGWEDSEDRSASERMELVKRSKLAKDAKVADGLTVSTLGVMRNGIGGTTIWETGLATNVASPKAAGT